MSEDYEQCDCGSGETYVSFAGNTCCYPCFRPLNKHIVVVEDVEARVIKDDEGWAVKINGITKKYFSKYEDYACTDARSYANKLNRSN